MYFDFYVLREQIWDKFFRISDLQWTINRNKKAAVFSILSDVVSEACFNSRICEWLELNYPKSFLMLKSVLASQVLPT